jgi:hypothetical protein
MITTDLGGAGGRRTFSEAATAAGEPTDEADTQWSDLQTRVSTKHKGKLPTPATTPAADSADEPDGDETLDNVAV